MEVQAINITSLNPLTDTKYIQCDNCNYTIKANSSQLLPTEGFCPNCGEHIYFHKPKAYPNEYAQDGTLLEINDEFVKQKSKEFVEHSISKEIIDKSADEQIPTMLGTLASVYRSTVAKVKAYMSFYSAQKKEGLNVQG